MSNCSNMTDEKGQLFLIDLCLSHKSSDCICVCLFLEIFLEGSIWCAGFDFQSKLLQPMPETIVLKANIFC